MRLKIKYNKKGHNFHPMYKLHWYSRWKYFGDRCIYACDGSKIVYGFSSYELAFDFAKQAAAEMRKHMLNE